ncbi:MAG: hypothetical protein VB108_10740 [Anaerolineaceae bacterium]|nr:hypothetical protein [Anaerolineaceae bacterium]
MDNKITIIEGPTPLFQTSTQGHDYSAQHAWAESVLEGPFLYHIGFTTVRTFNNQALVERCQRNWAEGNPMYLEYRDRIGLRAEVPILAAQASEAEEGQVLLLWVRLKAEDEEGFI